MGYGFKRFRGTEKLLHATCELFQRDSCTHRDIGIGNISVDNQVALPHQCSDSGGFTGIRFVSPDALRNDGKTWERQPHLLRPLMFAIAILLFCD
ncbi:hypothetical protein BD414DRAFT_53666 [Trametes punicea]|nr:hypothetical protein BD414DRAFT_53666 [Trametes punicea]